MRRREVLAALGPALAGCASTPPPRRTPTTTGTPLPAPITECRAMPDPPDDPTREAVRAFVMAHEEARVYNWLVAQNGGPDECLPAGPGSSVSSRGTGAAARVTVEEPAVAVAAETDAGSYLVSWCSGEARYRCPDEGRLCNGAGRNAHFVTHFLDDGRHVRVPSNWIGCRVSEEPYRAADPSENVDVREGEPALTFRVYDFGLDRDGDSGGHPVDVLLIHEDSGERVQHETYEPPYGPAVQLNAAARRGEYRLVATSGSSRTTHRFDLAGPDDPSMDGTCVYRGPDGNLTVVEVDPPDDRSVPVPVCWDRARRESTAATG